MKTYSIFCFLAALTPLIAPAQPCIYLAYDPFDYAANTPLESHVGGAGWSSPWSVQNGDAVLPGYQVGDGSAALAYGSLQTNGRYTTGGRAYLTAGRRLNTEPGGPFHDYVADSGNAIGTQTGSTLWISALLRKDKANGESVYAGLHSDDIAWCADCTGEKIAFGYFEGHSDIMGQRRWTLRIGDAYYPSNVSLNVGTTAFLVVKIQFNPDHTAVDFFVNPGALGNTTPTPVLTQNSASPFAFRSLAAYLGNSPGNGAIDEIRIAASYACVAPDNSVTVDLPPVAGIVASTTDGQAPLAVTFSGSTSYDPENGPLTYVWNFGDGSAEVSGVNQTHTFTALGNLTVRLRVQDAAGLENTAFTPIVVRDANNTFPCLSSFSLLQQASCSGNTGLLRVNDPPAVFSLKNAAGAVLPPVNGQEFQQLAAGQYTYTAAGANGCRDTFALYVPVDSTSCPGWNAASCDMAIGSNISGFADWGVERPMRNLMKHVRRDFIAFDDACSCWSNGNEAEIVTNADGYPTHLPQSAGGVENKLRFMISSEGGNLPPGQTYVLLYDGVASLTLAGATVTSQTPGRIQFDVSSAGNIFFNVTATPANNHLRNIRLLRLEDELADLTAQPFYQGFLDKIAPFGTLRFMDWGATNNNPSVHWSERTLPTHFTYNAAHGAPYEIMIRLANQTHKNVWVCVPHAADSAFIAQMAALFRDQLDPDLTIYLEYSNELWNWIFEQAHFNATTAPSNLNYGRAMAARAGQTFRIWHTVFGAAKSRVKRVLGLQAGFNYLNEQILAQLRPDEWDYGSPSSYIGLDHGATGQPVLNSGSTPQDILENARNNWYAFIPDLRRDYNNIKLFEKGIINYEGGQHFVGNVFGIGYPYQQAMYDAQYAPEIYTLYDDMLDTIRNWGSRMFGNFSLASQQESVYGSWGVLNDIDVAPPYGTTAPKYQALLDNSCPGLSNPVAEAPVHTGDLRVYPNPSGGYFWLHQFADSNADVQIQVSNVLGEVVQSKQVVLSAGENRELMDLSQMPVGLYQVSVLGGGQVRSVSVLVF